MEFIEDLKISNKGKKKTKGLRSTYVCGFQKCFDRNPDLKNFYYYYYYIIIIC